MKKTAHLPWKGMGILAYTRAKPFIALLACMAFMFGFICSLGVAFALLTGAPIDLWMWVVVGPFLALCALVGVAELRQSFGSFVHEARFLDDGQSKMHRGRSAYNPDGMRHVVATVGRGIHKRIDENRELLEHLQEHVPEYLAAHPWVIGWIKSHDDFFTELEKVAGVENPIRSLSRPWPRPWPNDPTTTST